MRRAARRLSSGQFISSWRLRMKCCPLVNSSHQILPGIGPSCWSILNPYFMLQMLVLDLPFYGKAMKACQLANLFRDESGPRCSSLWENHFPHDHSLQARKHHQLPNCHDQTAGHCGHRVLVGLETSDAQERQCMSCCSKCKYTNWYVCKYVQIYVFICACMHTFMYVCNL